LWFKLYFTAPGRYPLQLKVNDSTFYSEFKADTEIEVSVAAELSIRDHLGRLIDQAEAMLGDKGDAFREPSTADLLELLVSAHMIVPPEIEPLLKEVPSDPKDISTASSLRSHLRGLYDAQRALQ
jgi:hypothetical protein